jgi:hypothetical protein
VLVASGMESARCCRTLISSAHASTAARIARRVPRPAGTVLRLPLGLISRLHHGGPDAFGKRMHASPRAVAAWSCTSSIPAWRPLPPVWPSAAASNSPLRQARLGRGAVGAVLKPTPMAAARTGPASRPASRANTSPWVDCIHLLRGAAISGRRRRAASPPAAPLTRRRHRARQRAAMRLPRRHIAHAGERVVSGRLPLRTPGVVSPIEWPLSRPSRVRRRRTGLATHWLRDTPRDTRRSVKYGPNRPTAGRELALERGPAPPDRFTDNVEGLVRLGSQAFLSTRATESQGKPRRLGRTRQRNTALGSRPQINGPPARRPTRQCARPSGGARGCPPGCPPRSATAGLGSGRAGEGNRTPIFGEEQHSGSPGGRSTSSRSMRHSGHVPTHAPAVRSFQRSTFETVSNALFATQRLVRAWSFGSRRAAASALGTRTASVPNSKRIPANCEVFDIPFNWPPRRPIPHDDWDSAGQAPRRPCAL